jgi:saxitoxin biosynthesis operon SxtJ-like protein
LIDGDARAAGGAPPGMENPVRACRHFGLVVGGVFLLIALWPVALRGQGPRLIPLLVGGALAILAVVAPRALQPARRAWMTLGAALGWVNTRVLLAFAFYVIFTPLGLVLRALGRDPIRRAGQDDSYRVARTARPGSHMLRQF